MERLVFFQFRSKHRFRLLRRTLSNHTILKCIHRTHTMVTGRRHAIPIRSRHRQRLLLNPLSKLMTLLFNLTRSTPTLRQMTRRHTFTHKSTRILVRGTHHITRRKVKRHIQTSTTNRLINTKTRSRHGTTIIRQHMYVNMTTNGHTNSKVTRIHRRRRRRQNLHIRRITRTITHTMKHVVRGRKRPIPSASPFHR